MLDTTLSHYTILEKSGRGGPGEVPLVEQSLTRWMVGLPPDRQLVLNFSKDIAFSPDRPELFDRQEGGNRMMAVTVETSPQLKIGKPRLLFEGPYFLTRRGIPNSYDVSPDGRFLMIRSDPDSTPTQINVIRNGSEELERLVPPN